MATVIGRGRCGAENVEILEKGEALFLFFLLSILLPARFEALITKWGDFNM